MNLPRISNHRFSLLCHPAGHELLYRSRDGDVIKYDVETDDNTILVHNKKFVSVSSPGSVLVSHRTEELARELNSNFSYAVSESKHPQLFHY